MIRYGMAGDLARDKMALGTLSEDALRIEFRLKRRVLHSSVSGMGSSAQPYGRQKVVGIQTLGFLSSFSFIFETSGRLGIPGSPLDGLEFLRYGTWSEICSFVGVLQSEHDLSLHILLD